MYMEHHEITVSSVFSALECPWDVILAHEISVSRIYGTVVMNMK